MARPSPGARRVATVLEFLAARPEGRFTLSELARGCELNKATAHALLSELTSTGLLLRHPEEKRYSLGPRLVPIGEAAGLGYQSRDFRGGPLRALAAATGASVAAVELAPRRDRATVIDRAGPGAAGRATGGPPVPLQWQLTPPNGLVFFAWAGEPDVEAWLARSPVLDAVQHAVEGLEAARRYGFSAGLAVPEWQRFLAAAGGAPGAGEPAPRRAAEAPYRNGSDQPPSGGRRDLLLELAGARPLLTRLDEEASHDIAYLAAPVFDNAGTTAMALVAGWPEGRRCAAAEVHELGTEVRRAADAITEAGHGHRPPPAPVHPVAGPPSGAPGDGALPDVPSDGTPAADLPGERAAVSGEDAGDDGDRGADPGSADPDDGGPAGHPAPGRSGGPAPVREAARAPHRHEPADRVHGPRGGADGALVAGPRRG